MTLKDRRRKWKERLKIDKKNPLRYWRYLTFPFVLFIVGLMYLAFCWIWLIQEGIELLEKI